MLFVPDVHSGPQDAQNIVPESCFVVACLRQLGVVMMDASFLTLQVLHAVHIKLQNVLEHHTYTAYRNHVSPFLQVVLEVKGEIQLNNLAKKLEGEGVLHKVWVEQPEAYPTALATKPYPKSSISHHFKKFKLCKAQLS